MLKKLFDKKSPQEEEEIRVETSEEVQEAEEEPSEEVQEAEEGASEEETPDILSEAVLEAAHTAVHTDQECSADPHEAIATLRAFAAATPESPLGLDAYELVMRGLSYAADVAKAYNDGEIAGRNARIDLLKTEISPQSDGVPLLGGRPLSSTAPQSIFDLARQAF